MNTNISNQSDFVGKVVDFIFLLIIMSVSALSSIFVYYVTKDWQKSIFTFILLFVWIKSNANDKQLKKDVLGLEKEIKELKQDIKILKNNSNG